MLYKINVQAHSPRHIPQHSGLPVQDKRLLRSSSKFTPLRHLLTESIKNRYGWQPVLTDLKAVGKEQREILSPDAAGKKNIWSFKV